MMKTFAKKNYGVMKHETDRFWIFQSSMSNWQLKYTKFHPEIYNFIVYIFANFVYWPLTLLNSLVI